jgi:hypothetical protein
MGSGLLINLALEKYGEENFTKEILAECSSVEEMFALEKLLVVVDPEKTYNLMEGGFGWVVTLQWKSKAFRCFSKISCNFSDKKD